MEKGIREAIEAYLEEQGVSICSNDCPSVPEEPKEAAAQLAAFIVKYLEDY